MSLIYIYMNYNLSYKMHNASSYTLLQIYISMVDHNILTLLGGIDESERGTNLCNLMIRLVLHSSCIYFNLRYLCFRLSFFFYIIIQDGLTISLGLIVRANFQTNSKLKNTNRKRGWVLRGRCRKEKQNFWHAIKWLLGTHLN